MDNKELFNLFTKLKSGTLSQEESLMIQEYFETGKPEDLLNLIHGELEIESPDELLAESQSEQQIFNRVYDRIAALRSFRDQKSVRQFKLWPRIVAAASIVIAISIGIYFFKSVRPGATSVNTQYANDFAPGTNKATVTRANGKTIVLSDAKTGLVIDDAKLAYNDGTQIQEQVAPFDANEKMTVSTPNGGTYQITLSDGTRVWLNAASSLTYTANLKGLERRVKLEGEGYFEVAKDKKHPFIVESKDQQVEVLGTHFNIHSYADEGSIKTTLLEGSVSVSSGPGHDAVVLKPGQQSIVRADINPQVKEVNAENAVAWKNGLFMFNDEPLSEVMQKISRWYGVQVNIEAGLSTLTVYGTISRYNNVSKVLNMLEQTGEMQFEIRGNVINAKRK